MTSRFRLPRSGFTLVELLASIAILAILMSLIFSAYNQTARSWTLGEKRVDAFQKARLVLEMMGRELESAVAVANATSGRRLTFLNFPNATTLPVAAAQFNATPPNDQLFFISTAGDTARTADIDLTEYGYFVLFANADHQTMRGGHYYLVRHHTRSSQSGFDPFTNPFNWDETPGYSTSTKVPILDNVLRLEFRFQAIDPRNPISNPEAFTNGTVIVDNWTADLTCPNTPCACVLPSQTVPAGGLGIADPTIYLPRAVHIRLAILDRRYAARLQAVSPSGLSAADLGRVIPNCQGEDFNAISDPAIRSIIREGVHIFYKTAYLRNSL